MFFRTRIFRDFHFLHFPLVQKISLCNDRNLRPTCIKKQVFFVKISSFRLKVAKTILRPDSERTRSQLSESGLRIVLATLSQKLEIFAKKPVSLCKSVVNFDNGTKTFFNDRKMQKMKISKNSCSEKHAATSRKIVQIRF